MKFTVKLYELCDRSHQSNKNLVRKMAFED